MTTLPTNSYVMPHPLEEVLLKVANLHRGANPNLYVDIQARSENSASLKVIKGSNPWFHLTSFVDLSREDQDATRANFWMARNYSLWILLRGLGMMVMPIIVALLLGIPVVALLTLIPLAYTVALLVFFRQSHRQVQQALIASVEGHASAA